MRKAVYISKTIDCRFRMNLSFFLNPKKNYETDTKKIKIEFNKWKTFQWSTSIIPCKEARKNALSKLLIRDWQLIILQRDRLLMTFFTCPSVFRVDAAKQRKKQINSHFNFFFFSSWGTYSVKSDKIQQNKKHYFIYYSIMALKHPPPPPAIFITINFFSPLYPQG